MPALRLAVLLAACLIATSGGVRAACTVDEYITDDGSGCETCSKDGSKCIKCWDNYALSEGECIKCTVPEDAGGVHCETCSAGNTSYCEVCRPYCRTGGCRGYYAVEGQCVTCPSEGCAECDGQGTCLSCRSGYGLVDGECRPCRDENCAFCDGNLDVCTQCRTPKPSSALGYFLNATGGCSQCPFPCHECSEDGQRCTDCPHSPISADGNCTACADANCYDCSTEVDTCNYCKDGFRLVNGTCEACSVDNCGGCDEDPDTCTWCQDGFGLVDGECVACPDNCIGCDDDASVCATCSGDLAWDPVAQACSNCTASDCDYCDSGDAGRCLACSEGFTNDESGGCAACQDAHCRYCDLEGPATCDDCMDGWWADEQGTCAECPEGCQLCQNGRGQECDRCMDGYWMDADTRTCIKCTEGDAAKHGACPN